MSRLNIFAKYPYLTKYMEAQALMSLEELNLALQDARKASVANWGNETKLESKRGYFGVMIIGPRIQKAIDEYPVITEDNCYPPNIMQMINDIQKDLEDI